MDATTKITKNLGGDRLGSGNKNNITLHAYNRSNHDLSRAWRSSMNVGTLVPCFKELALNGETWSIDINALTRTVPTTAPIYGSFKQQIDMFVCPIRLYNGLLHNNMTKIGMKMEQVKLPKVTIQTKVEDPFITAYDISNSQTNPTSLIRYLGLTGLGGVRTADEEGHKAIDLQRKLNAVPILAYYDIYKNYYANKQEEKGVIIANGSTLQGKFLSRLQVIDPFSATDHSTQIENPSEPGSLIVTTKDTYQATENLVNMSALWIYGTQLPQPFTLTGLQVVLKQTTVNAGAGTSSTVYLVVNYATVFPAAGVGTGNYLLLGAPDSAYCSDHTDPNADKTVEFRGFTYNRTQEYTDGIALNVFDLANIDQARIEILKDTGLNNEFSINNMNFYPYKAIYERDADGKTANLNMQQGLAIKTYQSDLLQNWLQTEWIDGENGINQITAIDVSSGSFTIDALNLANKVYNMLNRIAVSGGSYEDWQEAVYSTEAVRRAEQPIYVGGASYEICFDEVVSTAATQEDPLGTLAGKGVVANKRGGSLEIRVDEPSYIIGIVSLTPRLDYSQGNDWDITELDTMDDLHKPALDGIGFEDLLQERAAFWGTYYDVSEDEWVKLSLGKTIAWINYMTAINKTYGDFAEEDKRMIMTLNRRYQQDDMVGNTEPIMGILDATTYIDPARYNYAFADTTIESQNFWVQIGFKCEVRRVMSAKQIPNL